YACPPDCSALSLHDALPSSPGVVLEMIARVPAPVGHIDPAAHGQRIVDHDDLLVVAAADRVDVIELQVDPLARQPAKQIEHHRAPGQQLERADPPFQDVNLEPRAMPAEPRDEVPEPGRVLPIPRLLAPASAVREMDARIEIPPDQQYPLTGFEHRLLHEIEIGLGVDDYVCSPGHREAPDPRFRRTVEGGVGWCF